MKDQPKISPTKLWRRLNEIEQEVSLGTFDNIIVAFLFLVVATIISILIYLFSDFSSLFKIVFAAALLMFMIFFTQLVLGYINSIFSKTGRFSNKIKVLSILLGMLLFLVLVICLPLIIQYFLPNLNQNSPGNFIVIASIVYLVPVILGLIIKEELTAFFVKNYPNLFFKKIRLMKKEDRDKVLKKLKITYLELKSLAEKD